MINLPKEHLSLKKELDHRKGEGPPHGEVKIWSL